MLSFLRATLVVRFRIGATGFEPATSWSQTKRSAKLSYAPWRREIVPQDDDWAGICLKNRSGFLSWLAKMPRFWGALVRIWNGMDHIASTLAPVSSTLDSYLPVVLIVVMAVGFGAFNLVATELIGPKVAGKVKMSTYESGMDPIGTARQRFHVRFYVLAMTFLLFDVEVVFLYPWAVAYTKVEPGSPEAGLYLGRVLFFVLTSIVAYVYAWRKGVFRFD